MALGLALVACGCASASDLDRADTDATSGALSILDVRHALGPGDRGPEVEAVTSHFKAIGYFPNLELERDNPEWNPIVESSPRDPAVYGRELAQAVMIFQRYAGLPGTGRIDARTLAELQTPRCGVPDTGLSSVDPSEKWAPKDVDTNGVPVKWSKTTITYKITGGSVPTGAKAKLDAALATWQAASNLTLQSTTSSTFDVEIKFWSRTHPPAASEWTIGSNLPVVDFTDPTFAGQVFVPGPPATPKRRLGVNLAVTSDLQTTLLHEIGHTLGLGHSSVVNTDRVAVMLAGAGGNVRTTLSLDDKKSIGLLYNVWNAKDGVGRDIAAGGPIGTAPKIYAMSNNNTVFFRQSGAWVPIFGNVAAIAVDDGGIAWAVSADRRIWKGSGTDPTALDFMWLEMTLGDGANDIAASGGKVWIVSNTPASGSAGNFVIKTLNTNGTAWDASNGGIGKRIAVDHLGRPWVVQAAGAVFRRYAPGDTINDPPGTPPSWQLVTQLNAPAMNQAACAKDIGAGTDHSVWIIGCDPVGNDFDIWMWDEQSGNPMDTRQEAEFRPTDGFASRITASPDGFAWVIQANGNIYQRAPRLSP